MNREHVPAEATDVAIRVSDLSKCYQIYDTPQDRLKQSIMPRLQSMFGLTQRKYFQEFWATRGIDFEVRRGDTLGVIGRNGSGKSTLLQMICGTLTPTAGEIGVNGRVAALLELGAGFNPEFTGRENVYLNAAVLGLSRRQIDERYHSIVEFADIGEFIDRPVKIYSSGMYVRLAFAVVAHVDADILVIDEALAVGDAVFSQKCMRFLRRFRERGTLIFVSHDTSAVINLCQTAIWLDGGRMRMHGDAKDVANAYLKYTAEQVYGEAVSLRELRPADDPVRPTATVDSDTRIELFDNIANSDGWTSGAATILSTSLRAATGEALPIFAGGERVVLTIEAAVHRALASPIIGFLVKDKLGQPLFGENTFVAQPALPTSSGQKLEASFAFALPLLPNGTYSMTVSIADGDLISHVQHHWIHDAVLIHISSNKLRYGLVGIPFEWVELHAR
jgi:lipopolysaccharide transport system ATP-binding protein